MSPAIANLAPGTELNVQTTLSAARHKETLWSDNQRLAVPVDGHPKLQLNVPLPKAEGVYSIHVAATRPSGFERFWSASTRLAERTFQVVVFDPQPQPAQSNARWESVLEIDPTNPGWVDRLPRWTQVRRIPGLNHGALGSIRAGAVDLPLGRFIELPPTAPAADPHWQAYSLPLEAVGIPHMLEIDYPADREQHIGVSIIEPNAAGVVSGINRDAGVFVEGLGRNEAKQKQSQRMVFWPRTQAPLLVVTNLHPTAAAHFGQIRVFKRSTNRLSDAPIAPPAHDRLIAAYLARPTLAETFGATRTIDPSSATAGPTADCIDDSQTSYESATRLADYLRYGGYNSAIISMSPRPLGEGRGEGKPLDVDRTELTLRVFDREQLALLPALDFAAPLPLLEPLRRASDPQTSGLEWVGADGRTWLEANGSRHGLAPYYNLLDPRVQQAMLQTVRGIIDRYGPHRAFAGLSIQLSGDGYAQLPPLDWGMDDATIARFERDTRIQLPDTGPERFASRHALLTGQHAAVWRSWRAAQVSAFYAQLAAIVRGNTDRRLVLTTENSFALSQTAARLRPNLLAENSATTVASILLDLGLDREALERVPGIVLSPTRYVEPTSSLPDVAHDLELNETFSQWRQPSSHAQSRSAVLYHRPLRQKIASFEAARPPWRVAGDLQLVCQSLPAGEAARQPYLEALAANDPAVLIDGGELLPLGQEDALRDTRSTLAQLPTSADVSEIAKQPIIVRTYAEADRTMLVIMNMSPWQCKAIVTVDLPQATTLEPLAASTSNETAITKPIQLSAGRQSWPGALAPYQMQALRIPIAGAKVVDVQVDLEDAANVELAAKITDLTNRDLTAPCIYPALANPSFEPLSGGRLPGWRLAAGSQNATAELDATNPQDGKTSLYFRCEAQPATIESDPFPVPPTGQLALMVYARGQNLAAATELRLVFEVDRDGQTYRQSARVTAKEMQHPNNEWGSSFVVFLNDLPLESRGQMRIAFQLTGPGEVWLDNAKLYYLLFPNKFYPNGQAEIFQLSKQIHAAKSAFDARQISDCAGILNSYWPRFVLAYRPPVQPPIPNAAAGQLVSPPQPNERQEPSPGISDRIKSFVPILR